MYRGESRVFLEASHEERSTSVSPGINDAVMRVREERVNIECGYDGVYGKVSILHGEKKDDQLHLS